MSSPKFEFLGVGEQIQGRDEGRLSHSLEAPLLLQGREPLILLGEYAGIPQQPQCKSQQEGIMLPQDCPEKCFLFPGDVFDTR